MVLLLEGPRRERKGVPDEHRSAGLIPFGQGVVALPQVGGHRRQDDFQTAAWMPEVGILNHPVEDFLRPTGDEIDIGALNGLAKRLAGEKRHVLTPPPQLTADPEEGKHVASRADGGQQVMSGKGVRHGADSR